MRCTIYEAVSHVHLRLPIATRHHAREPVLPIFAASGGLML